VMPSYVSLSGYHTWLDQGPRLSPSLCDSMDISESIDVRDASTPSAIIPMGAEPQSRQCGEDSVHAGHRRWRWRL
jgi:hypothetical protein